MAKASVNCLILGRASKNSFNVIVGKEYTNDDDKVVMEKEIG